MRELGEPRGQQDRPMLGALRELREQRAPHHIILDLLPPLPVLGAEWPPLLSPCALVSLVCLPAGSASSREEDQTRRPAMSELASACAGRLIRVLEDWTPAYPGICVYYPGHRHVPAGLRAFLDFVREVTSARG